MKYNAKKNKILIIILFFIIIIGIIFRFINFKESVYFGYDEARDAYISTEMFTLGDWKLLGPQASAFPGIHHGPFYYYLIGPLFLFSQGDPFFVSAFFRLINIIGIILLFYTAKLLFNPTTAIISAFLYAISYEQYIYAIFTGNPSISNISWVVMFLGFAFIKMTKHKKIGLFLSVIGASIIPQFDLIGSYSLITLLVIVILLKKDLKTITIKNKIFIAIAGFSPLYTYVLSEIKYNFLALKTGISIISNKTSIIDSSQSLLKIFLINLAGIFRNNVADYSIPSRFVILIIFLLMLFLLSSIRKNYEIIFVIIWISSLSFLLFTRGFMPFYSYAGIGAGLLLATGYILQNIYKFNKFIFFILISLITYSNVTKTINQSKKSLIVEIKAQPEMKLSDQINIVSRTYKYANGKGFTIRVTSMPYKIQTVWAYLYTQYGFKNNKYLPYYETGNIAGFPGSLPTPIKGETCIRFLIREPIRGIPENLILQDIVEENYFSDIVSEEKVGGFVLQYRKSKSADCHNKTAFK